MKRMVSILLALLLLLVSAGATAEVDAESALRYRLTSAAKAGAAFFACEDYDGDGSSEAFALVGSGDADSGYEGAVWFVNDSGAECLLSGVPFYRLAVLGVGTPLLFAAEEGYGGSASVSHAWVVANGQATALTGSSLEGISSGDKPGEFYIFPTAFDETTDGVGHTWKRYYLYLDGQTLREYGGIYITQTQFAQLDGGAEIIDDMAAEGYSLTEILYRANGVINLNFTDGSSNANVSVTTDGSAVSFWERDAGVYQPAACPAIATYPEGFAPTASASTDTSGAEGDAGANLADALLRLILPSPGDPGTEGAQPEETEAPEPPADWENPSVGTDKIPAWGEAASEIAAHTAALYAEDGIGEDGSPESILYVGLYDEAGELLDSYALLSWTSGLLENGAAVKGMLWDLGNGAYWAEGRFAFEGVSTNYLLLQDTGGAFIPISAVRDPGYSDGEGLQNLLTEEMIYTIDGSVPSRMLEELNSFFAADDIGFIVREIEMYPLFESGSVYSADLPDEALLDILELPDYMDAGPESGAPLVDPYPGGEIPSPGTASGGGSSGGGGYIRATASVNIRTGPGLGYGVSSSMTAGQTAQWLGDTSMDDRGVIWYKINYGGITGWVSSVYSEPTGSSGGSGKSGGSGGSKSSSGTVYASQSLNVRSAPSLTGKQLNVMVKGEYATYLGESSVDDRGVTWYKVNYGGLVGWVSSTYAVLK